MITVTLTRKALEAAEACSGPDSGMELFDRIKALYDEQRAIEGKPARRGLTIRWTPLAAVWLASAYPSLANWLANRGLIPPANLLGANLACAYLACAYLARAYLARASLNGANLAGANLRQSDLAYASLTGADLCEANLRGADLRSAILTRANLRGADLGDWERDPDTGVARRKRLINVITVVGCSAVQVGALGAR